MAVFAYALLLGAFFVFAFGATRLLLRNTFLEPYTVEASLLAGPAYVALALSAFAYRIPESVSFTTVLLLFLAGVSLSLIVGVCEWRRLGELARENAGRLLAILPPACFAAWVMMVYFPGNEWKLFTVLPYNAEYLNYAELAAAMAGRYKTGPDAPLDPFITEVRQVRCGQDLVTAAVAHLSGRHPINLVLPLSVFFRFQSSIALGLLLFLAAPPRQRRWLVPALLLFDGYHLAQVFTFSASFMSSNCTTSLFVASLLLAFCCTACGSKFDVRVVFALVLVTVYGLLCYPEFLAIVKCFELVILAAAVARRRWRACATIVGSNLAVCLLHPVLVLKQADFVCHQFGAVAGYNVFGHLLHEPLRYLGNCLGLRAAFVPEHPLAAWPFLANAAVVAALLLIVLGLAALASRHRAWPIVLAWLAFVLYLHGRPGSEGSFAHVYYYGAVKFLTQTHALVFAALAAVLAVPRATLRWAAGLALVLWASAAGLATARVFWMSPPNFRACFDYAGLQKALDKERRGGHGGGGRHGEPVACLVNLPGALWVLELAARECGCPLKPLSAEQAGILHQPPRFVPATATTKAPGADARVAFEGLVLVETLALQGAPAPLAEAALRFEADRVCARFGATCLCRGRIVYSPASVVAKWITVDSPQSPRLYIAGPRIRLRGEVFATCRFPMPYRFKCAVPELGWETTVEVKRPGPFEVMLDLPATAAGRVLALCFRDFPTCSAERFAPGNVDPTRFGFVLGSLKTGP
jgi:hypothetical protein